MDAGLLTILIFGSLALTLALGVPIAMALGGLSAAFIAVFWGPNALSILVLKAWSLASSYELLAVPLFIFMASLLDRSRIADDLYQTLGMLLRKRPGGLAVGTILICTIFAAMTGISGAATVSMGLLALPAMLRQGYNPHLALGTIAAGGSLGILIPPSITMIIYGMVAQVSIGKLFVGGVAPGLLLAGLFIAYIVIRTGRNPGLAPGAPPADCVRRDFRRVLRTLILPAGLVFIVLGSILTGLASITEAAALGTVGALLATLARRGRAGRPVHEATLQTLKLSMMIFWIVIGAAAFAALYTGLGAGTLIRDAVLAFGLNPYVVLSGMMGLLLLLGMVMETTGIIMIAVPVLAPISQALGFDPVWFGVLFIIVMEIGFLTPPFGFNLFYLRGVAPPAVTTGDIYRSTAPFVLLMLLGLVICIVFPMMITGLPMLAFG
ncbi:MAG: TRAP transporter large permease subunit [Rhodobacteraceae bacterium]|nr:TRAP transporter large permease subunit [Paracoccaceae bacterium]